MTIVPTLIVISFGIEQLEMHFTKVVRDTENFDLVLLVPKVPKDSTGPNR